MMVIYKLLWCREAEREPAQGLVLLEHVNVLQAFLALISCEKSRRVLV